MPRTFIGLACAVLLAVPVLAACGDDDDDTDATNTPGRTVQTTPTAAGSPAGTPGGTSTAGNEIEISADNLEFDKDELEASPGEVTVVFDNQEVQFHNIHFFEGEDATGESVAQTEITQGPTVETVTFTVEEGEYFYQCDTHPADMTGTLTVE